MMQLFIYRKSDGVFMYEDTGSTDGIIYDLGIDKDFTLTPPPNSHEQWRWIDNKWVADNTAS